jgi:predicted RNA-binding Zn-ribbon protein involved in translation (DUF1610 family)
MATKKNKLDVPEEITTIINQKLTDMETEWPSIPAQIPMYPRIEAIYKDILKGADFETIRKHFQTEWLPASLSGAGAWLPREIHEHLGRIKEETFVVKVGGFKKGQRAQYVDAVEYVTKHGDVGEQQLVNGAIAACFRCGDLIAVREAAHQMYCPTCRAKLEKTKAKSGNRITGTSKLNKDDKVKLAVTTRIMRVKAEGGNVEGQLAMLNALRTKMGLEGVDVAFIEKADSADALLQ